MKKAFNPLAVAIAAGLLVAPDFSLSRPYRTEREPSPQRQRPQQAGPIIDTTKESKRARRRRLATEASR